MIKYNTKRSSVRYNVSFDGYYSLLKFNNGSVWNKCKIIDLSISGTSFINSNFMIDNNDIMKLKIIINNKEIIQNGIVVNKSINRIGLKFLNITPFEEKKLAYAIHHNHINRINLERQVKGIYKSVLDKSIA